MYTVREQKLEAALILCLRMIDEALPLFNWGASALNANAYALLNEVPIAVRRALAEKIQIDVTLSPEAVAQMVDDITTEAQAARQAYAADLFASYTTEATPKLDDYDIFMGVKSVEAVRDMLTTLAAENATLRAERDAWTKIDVARDVDFATLRASEAAAMEALAEIGAVVTAIEGADSLDKEMIRNIRTRIAAITPTADKEPKT